MPAASGHGAWRRVVDLTVEPLAGSLPAEHRRLGRLVASTSLALIVLGGTMIVSYIVDPGALVAWVEFATMLVCLPVAVAAYVLARRGSPRIGAWLLILMASAAIFFLVLADLNGLNPIYHPRDGDTLAYMVLPIFVASATLSRRAAIIVSVIILAAMAVLPLVAPAVAWGQFMFGPWLLVAGFAALTIIFAGYRERLENDRTSRLLAEIDERKAAQGELARHRDELELLVAERTESLESANAELVEANKAKSRFLANMSHELRTPLNSIIGFTGIMRQGLAGPVNDEQERQLGMVESSSHQLLQLINQLLDLSRIESGHEVAHATEFAVDLLIRELADLVEPLASARGLSLDVVGDAAPGRSTPVTTDRGKLRQILLNLLGNAVKFTEHGGVTISWSSGDGATRIAVKDTGVGIPADALDSIFDEYHQVGGTRGAKPEGTGLGLALSRGLADLIGARIEVTSEMGVGSTFTVELPDARAL